MISCKFCQLHLLGPFPLSHHASFGSSMFPCSDEATRINRIDKTYFNIHSCTRATLWLPRCRLKLYNIDGRVTGEWSIGKYLEGNSRGLIEVPSSNLLTGNEENYETSHNPSPDRGLNFEPCKNEAGILSTQFVSVYALVFLPAWHICYHFIFPSLITLSISTTSAA